MSGKQWLKKNMKISAIFILPFLIVIMSFNFLIDPYWYFNHKNDWNDFQLGFDERELKTNKVLADNKDYDALLIGTSRLTYWNQHSFEDNKVFNYSLSSMTLKEYIPYIQFAENNLKGDIKKVYLEIYYGSFDNKESGFGSTDEYLNETDNPVDKIKKMYSNETLKRSLSNYEISKVNESDGPRTYNRDNVGTTTMGNENFEPLLTKLENTKVEERTITEADFVEYTKTLKNIKEETSHLEVIPMTELIPLGRLAYIWESEEDREIYKNWIRTTVKEFGELYVFHKKNSYTTDEKYWFDLHHYYPVVAEKMIDAVENPQKNKKLVDVVTEKNLENFFSQLEKDIVNYNKTADN
mgnify:CR=1 FL=1